MIEALLSELPTKLLLSASSAALVAVALTLWRWVKGQKSQEEIVNDLYDQFQIEIVSRRWKETQLGAASGNLINQNRGGRIPTTVGDVRDAIEEAIKWCRSMPPIPRVDLAAAAMKKINLYLKGQTIPISGMIAFLRELIFRVRFSEIRANPNLWRVAQALATLQTSGVCKDCILPSVDSKKPIVTFSHIFRSILVCTLTDETSSQDMLERQVITLLEMCGGDATTLAAPSE